MTPCWITGPSAWTPKRVRAFGARPPWSPVTSNVRVHKMKLEHPLLNLVSRCQTLCVAECCGADAYDFSPVHIASFLLMWEGKPNPDTLTRLRGQLDALKANYGTAGASADGAAIDDMNQSFTGEQIDRLVDEISTNLNLAVQICDGAERTRFRCTEPMVRDDG